VRDLLTSCAGLFTVLFAALVVVLISLFLAGGRQVREARADRDRILSEYVPLNQITRGQAKAALAKRLVQPG
jgi:hypothetical protein